MSSQDSLAQAMALLERLAKEKDLSHEDLLTQRDSLVIAHKLLQDLAQQKEAAHQASAGLPPVYDSLVVAQHRLQAIAESGQPPTPEVLATERDSLSVAQRKLHEMAAAKRRALTAEMAEYDSLIVAQRRLAQLAAVDAPPVTPEAIAADRDKLNTAQKLLVGLAEQHKAVPVGRDPYDSLLIAQRRLEELTSGEAPPRMLASERDSMLIARQMLERMAQEQAGQEETDVWIAPPMPPPDAKPASAWPGVPLSEPLPDVSHEHAEQERLVWVAGLIAFGVIALIAVVVAFLF